MVVKCLGKRCALRGHCLRYQKKGDADDSVIEHCDEDFRPGFVSNE